LMTVLLIIIYVGLDMYSISLEIMGRNR